MARAGPGGGPAAPRGDRGSNRTRRVFFLREPSPPQKDLSLNPRPGAASAPRANLLLPDGSPMQLQDVPTCPSTAKAVEIATSDPVLRALQVFAGDYDDDDDDLYDDDDDDDDERPTRVIVDDDDDLDEEAGDDLFDDDEDVEEDDDDLDFVF